MYQMEIGFIDYSREERNTILSTLKMLDDHTALDELGIGVIRDAYSDILFPGISTLQTRAKYFVLLPYQFQNAGKLAEKGKLRSGQEMLQWIHGSEDRLAATLTKNCLESEVGIVGSDASRNNRSVKIKPSQMYWNGMRTLGILRRDGLSILSACKIIYHDARQKTETEIKTDDGISFDDRTAAEQDRTLFLPIKPEYNYETDATMDLTRKEAQFLSECILRSPYTAGSLLRFFIKERMISDSFLSVPADILPDKLREDYLLARDFSRFIYGAHVRYNLIYSRDSESGADAKMKESYDSWLEEIRSDPVDLERILRRVSCGTKLSDFCMAFLENALAGNKDEVDKRIIRREIAVKGSRAKLGKPAEYRYDPANPIHNYRLDYRFNRAKVIIQDILKGLGGEQDV